MFELKETGVFVQSTCLCKVKTILTKVTTIAVSPKF